MPPRCGLPRRSWQLEHNQCHGPFNFSHSFLLVWLPKTEALLNFLSFRTGAPVKRPDVIPNRREAAVRNLLSSKHRRTSKHQTAAAAYFASCAPTLCPRLVAGQIKNTAGATVEERRFSAAFRGKSLGASAPVKFGCPIQARFWLEWGFFRLPTLPAALPLF
jgi:hypothetical protein